MNMWRVNCLIAPAIDVEELSRLMSVLVHPLKETEGKEVRDKMTVNIDTNFFMKSVYTSKLTYCIHNRICQ